MLIIGRSLHGDTGSVVLTSPVLRIVSAVSGGGLAAFRNDEVVISVSPAATAAVVTVVDGAIDQVLFGEPHRRSIVFDGLPSLNYG